MKPDKLDELELYILENVKVSQDIEYQFLIFRVIKNCSDMVAYLEDSAIRKVAIFQPILETHIEKMLANTYVLAAKYISDETYRNEIYTLPVHEYTRISSLELPTLLTVVNTLIHTSSEIANTMTDAKENEFLVSSLLIDLVKHTYNFCAILGLSVDEIRDAILKEKETLLRTTSQIIKDRDTVENEDNEAELKPSEIDIILDQGEYKQLQVTSKNVTDAFYNSGDIIKDFFESTRQLREEKLTYYYSEQLFDYFMQDKGLKQAYIFKGKLRHHESISEKELKYYQEHHEEFEDKFHHILINTSIKSMDDLLDHIYS